MITLIAHFAVSKMNEKRCVICGNLHQYFTSERYLRHLKIKIVSPHGHAISSFLTLKSLHNVTSSCINDPLIRHRPVRPIRLSSSQRLSRANHLSNRPQVSMVYRLRGMLVEQEKNL